VDTWDDLDSNIVFVSDRENNRIVVLKLVRPL
jgi:hypothetical protein